MPQLPLGPLGTFDTEKKSHLGVAIGLFSLLFFEIAAMGSPTMITTSIDNGSGGKIVLFIGAFAVDCNGDGGCPDYYKKQAVTCTDKAKPWVGGPGAPETECTKGLVTKCQSSQFFLIIGVLAHILSIPTPFIPKIVGLGPVPNLVGLVLVFLAAFSYFIVWCVWAYLINTKYSSDKISCGLNVDGIDENLGGAFACTIIAWLLCTAQAVLFVLGRNDSTDAYGSGKKQTKADKKAAAVMEAPPADEIDEDAVPQGDDDDL